MIHCNLLLCAALMDCFSFCDSKSSGSAASLGLSWTCLLVRIVFPTHDKRQGDTWEKLVRLLSILCYFILIRAGFCLCTLF